MADIVFVDQYGLSDHCKKRGLPIEPNTFCKMRCVGGGPPFQKWGRTPVYSLTLADRWIEERLGALRQSTSEPGEAA